MQSETEDVIASRELIDLKTNERITVLVYAPVRGPEEGEEWTCRTEIRDAREVKRFDNPGSDALAALILGISSLRYAIKQRGVHRLSWLDVEGWVGLPLVIPDTDEDQLAVIEKLVETESLRQAIWQKTIRKPGRANEE